MKEPRPYVVIADDHVPLRTGVRLALEADGFDVCAEAGSAPAAVEAVRAHRPDICLLDLSMPGNGLRAIAEIGVVAPGTNVVVLTVSRETRDLIAALRAGAAGYLLKDMDPSRLGAALRAVLAGEVALPRALVTQLVSEVRRHERTRALLGMGGRPVELTPREWEVIELLADAQTTAGIAVSLGLRQVTVRRHLSSAMQKLGVGTREEAVAMLNSLRSTD